jgi:hypothetical protein
MDGVEFYERHLRTTNMRAGSHRDLLTIATITARLTPYQLFGLHLEDASFLWVGKAVRLVWFGTT